MILISVQNKEYKEFVPTTLMIVLNGRTNPTDWVVLNRSGCLGKMDLSMNFYEYLTLLDLDEWLERDDHVGGNVESIHFFTSLNPRQVRCNSST